MPTPDDKPCSHCGLDKTPEGHDGCLGTLPGVMNACCGHGKDAEAYIQFPINKEYSKGICIRGELAKRVQENYKINNIPRRGI